MKLKNMIFILLLILVASTAFASTEKVVSIEENFINISAPETVYCQGTLCTIEYSVINLGDDKDIDVSTIFHSDKVVPLKLEKYGEITEARSMNNPYPCIAETETLETIEATSQENLTDNGTAPIVSSLCDNITAYDYTYEDFSEISSEKVSNEMKSKDKSVSLSKNKEQKFRAIVYQPLGQRTKYDIKVIDETNKETILDPFLNSDNYYINLTGYRYNPITSIAYYTADLNGSFIDKMNYANGTISSAVYNPSCKMNGCYNFTDNTGQHINLTTLKYDSLGTTFSVNVWAKTSATADYSGILQAFDGQQEGLAVEAGNSLVFWKNDVRCAINTTNGIEDGNWHMITVLYSANNNSLYKDGIKIAEVNTCTGALSSSSILVGYDKFSTGRTFNGNIDEISFYTSRLTDSQIQDLYNITKNRLINNSLNNNDNLTINSTKTGVIITYDSSIINQINDTALGNNLISGTCYNLMAGQTALNWSISANINYSKDMSRVVNYTFTGCSAINETAAMDEILQGILESEIGQSYNSYANKKVYTRLANQSQYSGTFDLFVVSGNKRWAFNYDQNSSSFPAMYNITPVFYVWQNFNLTMGNVKDNVRMLIDSTN